MNARVLLKTCLLAACFIYLPQSYLNADVVTGSQLINKAKDYDAGTVVFQGEVVGDIMRRGSYSWLNVYDGNVAVGVWAENSLLSGLSLSGSYKQRGDRIEIEGVFNRICKEHGGDMDIHARKIRKIEAGAPTPEKIDSRKKTAVILILGALFLIWILKRLRIR